MTTTTNAAKMMGLLAGATMLAGCSWLGGGAAHSGPDAHYQSAGYAPGYGAQAPAAHNPCQVAHAQAMVPQGCHPSQVTVGLNGFSQQPQFGAVSAHAGSHAGSHATAGYGSHAGGNPYGAYAAAPQKAKIGSRLRGSLGLGIEKSLSGSYLDYEKSGTADVSVGYDPAAFTETSLDRAEGNPDGTTTAIYNVYSAEIERINSPEISYDDVYSTPFNITGGLEYAVTPKASVFANAGYTYAEGNGGRAIVVDGILTRQDTTITTNPDGTVVSRFDSPVTARPNVRNIANFEYNFSDLRRIDLEAGGRKYFNPLTKMGFARVTPFVSAAAGASHHNAQSFKISQNQAYYQASFDSNRPNAEATEGNHYEVVDPNGGDTVALYDSQWVPRGSVRAGVEWQASERTAIAFESGVNVQGGKQYASTGERGDANVSIPLTIRGSFNF